MVQGSGGLMLHERVVKLGVHEVKVHTYQDLKMDGVKVNGYFDPDAVVICLEFDLVESMKHEIFMHELLHACWWHAQLGDDKQAEEPVVARIAPILTAVLVFNPWITEWIEGRDDPVEYTNITPNSRLEAYREAMAR